VITADLGKIKILHLQKHSIFHGYAEKCHQNNATKIFHFCPVSQSKFLATPVSPRVVLVKQHCLMFIQLNTCLQRCVQDKRINFSLMSIRILVNKCIFALAEITQAIRGCTLARKMTSYALVRKHYCAWGQG